MPECPRCSAEMVLRTARKGANEGNQFWGCSTFPKCRAIVPVSGADETSSSVEPESEPAAENVGAGSENAVFEVDVVPEAPEATSRGSERRDEARRRRLESVEPDASGRWDDDAHRREVLRYVHERDDGRCGVCGAETRMEAAQVEHIIPKIFAFFDIDKRGKATQGARYKSVLHKLDNLQASHTYCNKSKGNTADVARWRHLTMPPLTVAVAVAEDGTDFRVPQEPT